MVGRQRPCGHRQQHMRALLLCTRRRSGCKKHVDVMTADGLAKPTCRIVCSLRLTTYCCVSIMLCLRRYVGQLLPASSLYPTGYEPYHQSAAVALT